MRWTRVAVLASTLSIVIAGCGVGPSDRPGVAVERPGAGGPAPEQTTTPPEPPRAGLPQSDLSWIDCTEPTLRLLGLGPAPDGLVLECAEYSTPIDAAGAVIGNFRNGAMRARLPQTPADAPPLVLTSGSDRSSSATLAGLALAQNGLLAERPIVAVDRRGIGTSQPIDCLPLDIRQNLADHAQFGPGADPVTSMGELSQEATISCRDFLQPYESTFDAAHAADDIEQLRLQWQVEHIDMIGTGNGAFVALSYARKYGDHLARLVLDSPEAVATDAVTAQEQRLRGAEAALTGFAQHCVAQGCALGGDPRAAVAELARRAAAGELGTVSEAALLTAILGVLGAPNADRSAVVTELADTLAAARDGDRARLENLVLRENAATESDGQFVNRCTDVQGPPSATNATQLAQNWAGTYPVFGRQAAIGLMLCSAWPVSEPPAAPADFELPVLVLTGQADPVVGEGGQASVTGALGAAGARHATVAWQGWGHPVAPHSGCAQRMVSEYLNEGRLPRDGSVCPA
ncbi:alpha/beta hydrolase [Nocardia farcinica]|uniref:alpha/beta hydrolase n=1 Tax=Nocardia farcinica TaxID=37329 RepID=UPI0024588D25|nr:alpha/beta hydrolase [Nocardia farcinica]